MKFRQDVNGTTPVMKRILTNLKTVVRTAHPLRICRPEHTSVYNIGEWTHGTHSLSFGRCAECGQKQTSVTSIYLGLGNTSWVYVCKGCYTEKGADEK